MAGHDVLWCRQIGVPAAAEQMMGVWNHERHTGEDCLVLNVWTSGLADSTLLIWDVGAPGTPSTGTRRLCADPNSHRDKSGTRSREADFKADRGIGRQVRVPGKESERSRIAA